MLVIGSTALRHYGIDVNRPVKDVDYIGTFAQIQQWISQHKSTLVQYYPLSKNKFYALDVNGVHHEFEIAWDSNRSATELLRVLDLGELTFVEPNVVLTLKLSHRYLKNSPHFLKTMDDIIMLRNLGYKVPEFLKQWLVLREQETYTYAHPKLNTTKDKFFSDDNITYVYDHDDIHQAVRHLEKPAYEYFKKPGEDVWCDKELFFSAKEIVRLFAVIEEAYVLAIERSLVPHPGVLTPKQAFEKALMKVCTSITSGWFREYAWEHYYQAKSWYTDNYWDKFKLAVDIGAVQLLTSNK